MGCKGTGSASKELPPLREGDNVLIQNQDKGSRAPTKWDRQGIVVKVGDYDQYLVRVIGSGRLTLRNSGFLKKCREIGDRVGVVPQVRQAQRPPDIPVPTQLSDEVLTPIQHVSDECHPGASMTGTVSPPLSKEPLTPVVNDDIARRSTVSPPLSKVPITPIMEDVDVRRSTHMKKQRQFYDAHSGTFV